MTRGSAKAGLCSALKTGVAFFVGATAAVALAGQVAARKSRERRRACCASSTDSDMLLNHCGVDGQFCEGATAASAANDENEASRVMFEDLAQAAEEAACDESAANIMVAVAHTPGLAASGIARGVLESLLPDDEVIVLPKVNHIAGAPAYRAVKRAFDLVSCSAALVALALPMGIIALKIKHESDGPAIFSQHRLGKDGEVFSLYKFRTMYTDAELKGAQWATEGDPRVTPLGKVLRATRLDELPQFWNVVKGDMSLIGPRPERPIFSEEFARRIDGWNQRLLIRPGVSGLAQVTGGYELLPKEKARYDIEYIENRSLSLDIRIIVKTLVTVFRRQGAR